MLQLGLLATIAAGAASNLLRQEYYVGLLCGINTVFLLYGLRVFIGFDHAWTDLLQRLQLQTSAPGPSKTVAPVVRLNNATTAPARLVNRAR
jgi:hypothetical protein